MKYRLMFVMILGAVLLVLAGCSSVGSTSSGSQAPTTTALAQVVHVTLSDQQISADRSTFRAWP